MRSVLSLIDILGMLTGDNDFLLVAIGTALGRG